MHRKGARNQIIHSFLDVLCFGLGIVLERASGAQRVLDTEENEKRALHAQMHVPRHGYYKVLERWGRAQFMILPNSSNGRPRSESCCMH